MRHMVAAKGVVMGDRPQSEVRKGLILSFCGVQRDLSPEADETEAESQAPGGPGAVQTPISAALSLMQKMDGVARLLGGQSTAVETHIA